MRAQNFVGCVRARGMPARLPARHPAARQPALAAERAPVAKTDTRIVFLVEFWV